MSLEETQTSKANPTEKPAIQERILKCQNGGVLIENNCICLNQFSGLRCERPPDFQKYVKDFKSDQLLLSKLIPKSNFEFRHENNNFDFDFSNLKSLNATFLKSVVWPWNECKHFSCN